MRASDREPPRAPRAERAVAALFGASSVAALGFVVAYAFDPDTQLLGVALGVALAAVAFGLAVVGSRLVPQVRAEEPLPPHANRPAEAQLDRTLVEGASGLTRRRLLLMSGAGTAGALGAALFAPFFSLGPAAHPGRLRRSPWARGVRLVGDDGAPIRAADVNVGASLIAFPERVAKDTPAAALTVVRLRPLEVRLPPERAGWAPLDILAFSSVCTHAGCAVTLFRFPTFEQTSEPPALVCPCHYSTFDVGRGGDVTFGPAGRPLPQLPLAIDDDGVLVAAGPLSGAPGPSWWGVRA